MIGGLFKKSYSKDAVLSYLQDNKSIIRDIAKKTMRLKTAEIKARTEKSDDFIFLAIDGHSKYGGDEKSVIHGYIQLYSKNVSGKRLWIAVWLYINDSVDVDDFTSMLKQIEESIRRNKQYGSC